MAQLIHASIDENAMASLHTEDHVISGSDTCNAVAFSSSTQHPKENCCFPVGRYIKWVKEVLAPQPLLFTLILMDLQQLEQVLFTHWEWDCTLRLPASLARAQFPHPVPARRISRHHQFILTKPHILLPGPTTRTLRCLFGNRPHCTSSAKHHLQLCCCSGFHRQASSNYKLPQLFWCRRSGKMVLSYWFLGHCLPFLTHTRRL